MSSSALPMEPLPGAGAPAPPRDPGPQPEGDGDRAERPAPRDPRVPQLEGEGNFAAALEARYEMLQVIDAGAMGTVFQARDRSNDQIVAVKHLRLDSEDLQDGVPAQVVREISTLRDFKHPNIVELLAVHIEETNFNLVFEFGEISLHAVLRARRHRKELMPMDEVARYSMQLMRGIHACHCRLIMHRDLKPQNILISDGSLKICDFGLARFFGSQVRRYTHEVITLWYRAPEILLGAQSYGSPVDMWSAGCIIIEMATGRTPFPGDSEIGTIFKIFQLVGTPTEESWPAYETLGFWRSKFPRWPATDLRQVEEQRPELDGPGMDLLRGLLRLDPTARLTARTAKVHPFFGEVRQQESLL